MREAAIKITTTDGTPLYTTNEVAELLEVTPQTVSVYIHKQMIEPFRQEKIKTFVFFTMAEIKRLALLTKKADKLLDKIKL